MIDEKEIMPFNFFKYNGVYSADNKGMRYVIKRIGDKPDFKLSASVWPGPYCYADTSDQLKTKAEFEYSEAGRIEAIHWLEEQYSSRQDEWNQVPSILDAPIDMDVYLQKEEKKEE